MTRKSFPFLATGGELKDLEQPGYYAGLQHHGPEEELGRSNAEKR